jgi:hypothetical protein
VVYAVAAVAYLLGAAVLARASKTRWRVVTVVGVGLTGLVTLLPVRGFSGPIGVCEGVGDGAECYVDYGQSRTLIGLTVEHRGDLEGPYLGHDTLFVIGLMVTAVAVLVAIFLVNRSARLRRI